MVSKEELRKKYKLKVLLRGPTGTSKCCKGDTLILTDKGLMKIEDIVHRCTDSENKDSIRPRDRSQLEIFDCVEHNMPQLSSGNGLTVQGLSYGNKDPIEVIYADNVKNVKEVVSISPQLEYKKFNISAKYDIGEEDTISIKTSLGFDITGTPEHRVVVINEDGNLVFKKLEDVTNKDNIAVSYNTNIFNDILKLNYRMPPKDVHGLKMLKNIDYMNKDIARLIGYIVSEGVYGFTKDDKPFFVTITNYDKEVIDDILKICNDIGMNIEYEYVEGKNQGNPTGIKITSVIFADFIYYLGYRHLARNKEVPWSILQADKDSQIAFLAALFDGDGTVSCDEDHMAISYGSSSRELCRQLQLMLLNMGIISRLHKVKGATIEYKGELKTYDESYRLDIYGENILKFADNISFGLNRKRDILAKCVEELDNRSRWTDITFPNIDKKLNILYEKLKWLGRMKGLYMRDGDRVKYMSSKAYLKYYGFQKEMWSYISGYRKPSKMTLDKILDIMSPTKDMKTYSYLRSLSQMFIFDNIEEITESEDMVYDITIDNIHSYIGNGFINHNTYCCVKASEEVAKRGWKVLYLDHERGSEEELMKLDDKTLENIIHEDFENYKALMNHISRYTSQEKDRLKLIIIDPMPVVEIARLSARDAFLEQGYYHMGEKKIEIDNKDTFDLKGFMYQLATTYQQKLLNIVTSCEQDIICTLMTPNKHETEYDGKFSIVMESFTAWVGNKIYYKAIPKKMRGVDLNAFPAIDNPHSKLLEALSKKYDGIKFVDIFKLDDKKEEEKMEDNEGEENNSEKVEVK